MLLLLLELLLQVVEVGGAAAWGLLFSLARGGVLAGGALRGCGALHEHGSRRGCKLLLLIDTIGAWLTLDQTRHLLGLSLRGSHDCCLLRRRIISSGANL